MEKQPFTPDGVAELQKWLYGLPDIELQEQVSLMEINFSAWGFAHLSFTEQQIRFYHDLNPAVINFLASQCIFAASYRRPVRLIVTADLRQEPLNDGEDDGKLFKPKSSLSVTGRNNGTYEVGGGVDIDVSYIH